MKAAGSEAAEYLEAGAQVLHERLLVEVGQLTEVGVLAVLGLVEEAVEVVADQLRVRVDAVRPVGVAEPLAQVEPVLLVVVGVQQALDAAQQRLLHGPRQLLDAGGAILAVGPVRHQSKQTFDCHFQYTKKVEKGAVCSSLMAQRW